MVKNFILIVSILFFAISNAQDRPSTPGNLPKSVDDRISFDRENDTTRYDKRPSVKLSEKTVYTDYKVISYKNDTTYIDTTLSINKNYKFNFLRKDDFELLAFHNQGQTFNNLGYTYEDVSLYPIMGARAMHLIIMMFQILIIIM